MTFMNTHTQVTEEKIGKLYGSLFTAYDEKLFEDSVALFCMRHEKWGFDLGKMFSEKVCLDAGCGGGRYVVALVRLGAKKVCGIDVSKEAIEAAQVRVDARGLSDKVELKVASVLDIPYEDAAFDYVVSSGVIHHTPDPKKGFRELTRVLKPGGTLFLSVYGRGGLIWFLNDIGRVIARVVPFKIMEGLWKFVGIPANKRYNYLDNMYVQYCYRYTEKEIRSWLEEAGYCNIRRMKFERYDYETLKSRLLNGEGWLQFYADKK